MAFDGIPIGISDGLPEGRRLCRARARISACPGLENALGEVEMSLVPGERNPISPIRSMGSLPLRLTASDSRLILG